MIPVRLLLDRRWWQYELAYRALSRTRRRIEALGLADADTVAHLDALRDRLQVADWQEGQDELEASR